MNEKFSCLDIEIKQMYTKCTKMDSTHNTAERRDAYETRLILTFCHVWSKNHIVLRKETDFRDDYRDG